MTLTEISRPDAHRFPCETCGSDLRYAPGAARLVCDHCGNSEEITGPGPWAGAIAELDFRAALTNRLAAEDIEETRVLACPNCGAEVEFAPEIHAKECPFCATPVVTDTGAHRHIKPRGLVPFALDEAAAKEAMTRWLGGLWFAPNGLQAYARKGRRMQGIYVPYWTFDARTRSDYRGQRGTVYFERRNDKTVRKIRWKGVQGRVARAFDDVLVLASTSLPKGHTDALEPWDLSQLEPYQPEYLAGFRAEGYQVPLEAGFVEAREIMDRIIARDVRFDIGGDRQRIDRIDTEVSDVTFKHVLLPIWVAAYRYRGQSFQFVVNGLSGRVSGQRPWSAVKLAFAALALLLVAAGLAYLYALDLQ